MQVYMNVWLCACMHQMYVVMRVIVCLYVCMYVCMYVRA